MFVRETIEYLLEIAKLIEKFGEVFAVQIGGSLAGDGSSW